MKLYFALFIMCLPLCVLGQGDLEIAHFQTKANLKQIVLPGDQFDSSETLITLTDSLYTAGTVNFKTLRSEGLKLKNFSYNFSDQKIGKVIFQVKGKKTLKKLKKLWSSKLSNFSELDFSSNLDTTIVRTDTQGGMRLQLIKEKNSYFFSLNVL